MASPVELYQKEMHKNVGFFATWLPASILDLGDVGVLEGGRFRKEGSLKELGISAGDLRQGTPQSMSYAASAERNIGASAGASAAIPVAQAEVSIRFTQQGGYVFEAAEIRQVEIANRMALAQAILDAFERGTWQEKWLVVDAMYQAASATIIVSEDSSSEIVLKAHGNVPLGPLPLADPKLQLSVSSSSGKIVNVVAAAGLSPLYSCLKVNSSWFGKTEVGAVRGLKSDSAQALKRTGISELLTS